MGTNNGSGALQASDLSAVAQDYLKLVWLLREWSDEPVTVGLVAERLGVSPSTASEGIRKYATQGLLTHARYGGVELTPTGLDYALAMVRRHRLLETFLVQKLGYRWDEVHHEAEVLEHAVSDTFIARIDELLGHPQHDPHGDPIPQPGEHPDRPDAVPLVDAQPGQAVSIRRVSDESAELLRYFAEQGLVPDAQIIIQERKTFTAGTPVRLIGTGKDISLGDEAAAALWVEGAPSD